MAISVLKKRTPSDLSDYLYYFKFLQTISAPMSDGFRYDIYYSQQLDGDENLYFINQIFTKLNVFML